jgi:class 3 adenylate cyclase
MTTPAGTCAEHGTVGSMTDQDGSGQAVSIEQLMLGPTVNIAARLTSIARPGTVIIDSGLHDALDSPSSYSFRRLRGVSVKGYPHLPCWVLRRASTLSNREFERRGNLM